MKKYSANKSRRGFSLIELLIVIAIIGTLAAIGYTAAIKISKNSRLEKNREIVKSLETAFKRFYEEYRQLPYQGAANDTELESYDPNNANLPFAQILRELEGDTKNNTIEFNIRGLNYLDGFPEASETGVGGIVRNTSGEIIGVANAFGEPLYVTLDLDYNKTIQMDVTSFKDEDGDASINEVKGRHALIWTEGPEVYETGDKADDRIKNW